MDQFFRACRGARDRLQNIPSRTAGLLAAMTDQQKIFSMLTTEIHDALEALFHEEDTAPSHAAPRATMSLPR